MAAFRKDNYYSRIAKILIKYLNLTDNNSKKSNLKKKRLRHDFSEGGGSDSKIYCTQPFSIRRTPARFYPLKSAIFRLSYQRLNKLLTLYTIYSLENFTYSNNFWTYPGYVTHGSFGIGERHLFAGFRGFRAYSHNSLLMLEGAWDRANHKSMRNPWVYLQTSQYLETKGYTVLFVNPLKLVSGRDFVRVTDIQYKFNHQEYFKLYMYFTKPRAIYYEELEEEYFRFHNPFKRFERKYKAHWFHEMWWTVLSFVTFLTKDLTYDGFSFFWTSSTHEANFDSNFMLRRLVYDEIAWPFFSTFSVFNYEWRLLFLKNFPLYLLFFVYKNIPEMLDGNESAVKQEEVFEKSILHYSGLARFKKYVKYSYFVKVFKYPYKFLVKLPKLNYTLTLIILLYYVNFINPALLDSKSLSFSKCAKNVKFLKTNNTCVKSRKLIKLWKMNNVITRYSLPLEQSKSNFEFFANRSVLSRATRFPLDLDVDLLEDYDDEWFEPEEDSEHVESPVTEIDNYYLSYFFDKTKLAYLKLYSIYEFFFTDFLSFSSFNVYSFENKRSILTSLRRASRYYVYKAKRKNLGGFYKIFNKLTPFSKWYKLLLTLTYRRAYIFFSSNTLLKKYFSYNNTHRPLFLFIYIYYEFLVFLFFNFRFISCDTWHSLNLYVNVINYYAYTKFLVSQWLLNLVKVCIYAFLLAQLYNLYIVFFIRRVYVDLRLRLRILFKLIFNGNFEWPSPDLSFFELLGRLWKRAGRASMHANSLIFNRYFFWILFNFSAVVSFFYFIEFIETLYTNLKKKYTILDKDEFRLNFKFWIFTIFYFLSDLLFSVFPSLNTLRIILRSFAFLSIFFIVLLFFYKFFNFLIYGLLPVALILFFLVSYTLSSILRGAGFIIDFRNTPILQFFEFGRFSKNNLKWVVYFLNDCLFWVVKKILLFFWVFFFICSVLIARILRARFFVKDFFYLIINFSAYYLKGWFAGSIKNRIIFWTFLTSYRVDVLRSTKISLFRILFFYILTWLSGWGYGTIYRIFFLKSIWSKLTLSSWVWLYKDVISYVFGFYNWWGAGILHLKSVNSEKKNLSFSNNFKSFFLNRLSVHAYFNKFNYAALPVNTPFFFPRSLVNFFFKYFIVILENVSVRFKVDCFELFFLFLSKIDFWNDKSFFSKLKTFYDDILLEIRFSSFLRNWTAFGLNYSLHVKNINMFKKFDVFFSRKTVKAGKIFFFFRMQLKILYNLVRYLFITFFMTIKRLVTVYAFFCLILFVRDLIAWVLLYADIQDFLPEMLAVLTNFDFFYILLVFFYFFLKILLVLFFIKRFS